MLHLNIILYISTYINLSLKKFDLCPIRYFIHYKNKSIK